MMRRISLRGQRIPMVDAVTLEDRTRPSDDAPMAPVKIRLAYSGWSAHAHAEAALQARIRERDAGQSVR